jgi:VWFA-related protein
LNLPFKLVARTLIGVLVTLPSMGQSAPDDAATTIAVDVKVVTLPVTVRDKHGEIVRSLTKDDFVLHDDGHLQTIRYFSQDSNLPLTLGLLVDTSLSQRNVLDQERNASRTFLAQMLTNDKDKAFVLHFDHEVELLQDLTSSHSQLESALDLLQMPRLDRSQSGDSQPDSQRGSHRSHGGGTLLYDAVYLASTELMQKQQGRKAVIILSDGVDRGSKESLESAIAAAQHADTIVYSILFTDEHKGEHGGDGSRGRAGVGWPGGGGGYPGGGWPGGGGGRRGGSRGPQPTQESHADGKKILERISKETGGRLYTVSKKESVGEIYDSIAEELRTQYSLGYTPTKGDSSSGYHRITLEARNKDLNVQTRDGYDGDH